MQLHEFGLLTDENIDPALVRFFRENGLDVKEQKWEGRKDKELLLPIAHEQNRVIITHDSDFGMLVFTQGVPFTEILYLRPGHFDATPHIQSITPVLAQNLDVAPPFILIAENGGKAVKIRLRRL